MERRKVNMIFLCIFCIIVQIGFLYLSVWEKIDGNFFALSMAFYFISFVCLFYVARELVKNKRRHVIAVFIIAALFVFQMGLFKSFDSHMILQGRIQDKRIVNKQLCVDILPEGEEETISVICDKVVFSLLVEGELYAGISYKTVPLSEKLILTNISYVDMSD